MNNILLNGGISDLDNYANNSSIIVSGVNTLNVININDNIKLDIKLQANSILTLNMFDFAYDKNIDVNIEADDNCCFNLNAAFICENNYNLKIHNNLYGNDIKSNVEIRGINESNGTSTIMMDGVVVGETNGNILNEYARIINKSDASNVVIPNLIVNTSEVTANHGVSIGSINKDEIFYLLTKGINRITAEKLIEEGFLKTIMDEDIKERIKNILIGR